MKEEQITLIIGKHNSTGNVFCWRVENPDVNYSEIKIGDYAIVENKNDLDLVKIMGFVETTRELHKNFTGVNELKKVVLFLREKGIKGE